MTTKTPNTARQFKNVPCPFCGLCCDDLALERKGKNGKGLKIAKNGCDLARRGFEVPTAGAEPRIAGKMASFDEAVAAAAAILKNSDQPLFSGMGTDIEGAKAVMQLADGIGGVVDHAASHALFRNFRVMQNSGWMTTTVAEIRNRADLVIFAGTDGASVAPRFFDKCIWPKKALFTNLQKEREVVFLGRGPSIPRAAKPPKGGKKPTLISYDTKCLAELFGTLRALYHGRRLDAKQAVGVAIHDLENLIEKIKAARYGVIVWASGQIEETFGDLAVQAIAEFIKDINETKRFAGFPLGGGDNALGVAQVGTWQSGFPLRTAFGEGHPVHDPYLLSGRRLLAEGEADALVWTSAFRSDLAPPKRAKDIPCVLIGVPGMKVTPRADVYLPVATPGIDHAGSIVRTDSVVALPLRKLRDNDLPSVAEIVGAIETVMRRGA